MLILVNKSMPISMFKLISLKTCSNCSGINTVFIKSLSRSLSSHIEVEVKSSMKKDVKVKDRKENNKTFDMNEGDTFGTLDVSQKYIQLPAEYLPDDEDGYDKMEWRKGERLQLPGYNKLFNQLLKRGKPVRLTEALQAFEKMKVVDRIPAEVSHFTMLISACARVGYTKKAFQLFEELLDKDLKVTKAMITSLFNSCAECPFKEFGLEKANYLRDMIHERGYLCNSTQYHAMIKAFGKLGDLQTAFRIVDEMVEKQMSTTSQTFAMLLIGCISDRESGLYHAIRIIRKMRYHRVNLDVHTFNLLLRAVRDCGIGTQTNVKLLIDGHPNSTQKKNTNKHYDKNYPRNYMNEQNRDYNQFQSWTSLVEEKNADGNENVKTNSHLKEDSRSLNNNDDQLCSPNLNSNVSLIPHLPNLLLNHSNRNLVSIDANALSNISNRLLLVGGIQGLLKLMRVNGVEPTIQTFTLMLDSAPIGSESQVYYELVKHKVKPDNDFFNNMIKKVSLSRGVTAAKEILSLMQSHGLQPDVFTYGVLALGCHNQALATQLLSDMEKVGVQLNKEIVGSLLGAASRGPDFIYITYLIKIMQKHNIQPTAKQIELLELRRCDVQDKLARHDRRDLKIGEEHLPSKWLQPEFREGFAQFKIIYQNWLAEVKVNEEHPWEQFKVEKLTQGRAGMNQFERFMKMKLKEREKVLNIDIDRNDN